MIYTIDTWLVIKSTVIGKIGAFFIASSPIILAAEMTNHIDAVIAAIPPTLAVILGVVALKRGQNRMFIKMDGRMTELLEVSKQASKSEGREEERVEARERASDSPTEAVPNIANDVPKKAVKNKAVKPNP